MAAKIGTTKLLLWIGITLFFFWFLLFSLAPAGILNALVLPDSKHGLFLRLFGVFSLGWIALYLYALKDVEKNIAIINSGIITAAFLIIVFLMYVLPVSVSAGWFIWLNLGALFVYNLLLFIFKPKPGFSS